MADEKSVTKALLLYKLFTLLLIKTSHIKRAIICSLIMLLKAVQDRVVVFYVLKDGLSTTGHSREKFRRFLYILDC